MNTDCHKIIITGASQGLGFELSKTLATAGCHLTLCARDHTTLQQSAEQLRASHPHAKIEALTCNVAHQTDVNHLVAEAISRMGRIDALVLNAGVYGPMGKTDAVDLQEWQEALEINLFGILLPCRAAIPHFRQQGYGKIVAISGGGATKALPGISAYAASKTAAIRLLECLALELQPDNIQVNAVAPGALRTRLTDQVLAAGPEKVGSDFFRQNQIWKEQGATDPALACRLVQWLLSSDCPSSLTGKLISAPWDNWQQIPDHIKEISSSDIFCLRRIVPPDRGQTWQ
jgi:NAD(P)-dependent dehydrogenase (short-subunit alcohol dehydrogenase family)